MVLAGLPETVRRQEGSLNTRTKLAIARALYRGIHLARTLAGRGDRANVARNGVRFSLDLREGIDLALYLGVYERGTSEALRRLVKPGAVVVDVGANVGAHALPLGRLVGETGRVFAFEPTRYAHEKLLASLALNPDIAPRVVVERAFLSDARGEAVPEAIYSSWPLASSEPVHATHQGAFRSTEGARSERLDDYLERAGVARVDLVKMDVDGYECEVLGGAPRLLASGPTIVLELAAHVLAERGRSLAELVGILRGAGYRLEDETTGHPLPEDLARLEALIPTGGSVNAIARVAAASTPSQRGPASPR